MAHNEKDLQIPIAEYAYLRLVLWSGPRHVPRQFFELVMVNYLIQAHLMECTGKVIEVTKLGKLAARAPYRTEEGGTMVSIDARHLSRPNAEPPSSPSVGESQGPAADPSS